MSDSLTEEMVQKLSAERVRLVHANERLLAEVKRLRSQVDALNDALTSKSDTASGE